MKPILNNGGRAGNPRGGYREGAGRPSDQARLDARECFFKIGGWKEVERIYNRVDDGLKIKIINDILNRGYGLPTQEIEIDGLSDMLSAMRDKYLQR